ncbi:MAG: protein kinase [Planctomycetes bacterium]|nr:protein kinase [Planctomycetota bacterium]
MTEREIFETAVEITDPIKRAAFLNEACHDDATMRGRIEALLVSHENASKFLNVPAVEQFNPPADVADSPTSLRPSAGGQENRRVTEVDTALDISFLQPSSRPDSIGTLGHYEILQVLGHGGFGIVFKAFDAKLRRLVAIKVMPPQISATSPPRKRFLREARSAAAIKHENIVQVYSVEELPLPYLVMEYVEGQTLQQKMEQMGPLELPEILHLGQQVASGLLAAHYQGLIHRDIKPGNILLEAGPVLKAKITDFGLARATDDASMTRTGVICGTPIYMSPEQAQGQALDQRSDLFSLGSVLYQMACGRPPFRAPNTVAVLKRVADETPRPIQEIIPEVPDWLCDIISKLHAKQPENRFQSAKELVDLLARCQSELKQHGRVESLDLPICPENAPARERRLLRKRGWAAAAVFVTLFAGVGLTEATGLTNVWGTIIRLVSPEDMLVVEVNDPGVTASVNPDRKAAEYVLSIGGNVGINGADRYIKNASELPTESIELTYCNLRGNKRLGEDGVHPFKGCSHLTYLDLSWSSITDAGLAYFLNCKDLNTLYLDGTRISDAGLANLRGCQNLTSLALTRSSIGDSGVANFKGCTNLTELRLGWSRVSDAGLARFKDCKKLTLLYLDHCNVTDTGLACFQDCMNLKALLVGETNISDAGLAGFKDCLDLEWLNLDRTHVTDAGMDTLSAYKKLNTLNLSRTQVSDDGLLKLANCKNLRSLVLLRMPNVTAAGMQALAIAIPQCRVTWEKVPTATAETAPPSMPPNEDNTIPQ